MRYDILRKGVIGGLLLLFIGTGVGSAVSESSSTSPQVLGRGNWLYVGGSGPGNYTSIQGAIDNASDGDTVFVFDDSSPYYENVTVDKRITLIGEEKETTIIDGTFLEVFIHIKTDGVTVAGFTVRNATDFGFIISSNQVMIHNNIIKNSCTGIGIAACSGIISDITITNNTLSNDGSGIFAAGTNQLNISNNNITYHDYGIMLGMTLNTTIQSNSITDIKTTRTLPKKDCRNLLSFHFPTIPFLNDTSNSTAICSLEDNKVSIINNVLQGYCTLLLFNSSNVTFLHNTFLFTDKGLISLGSHMIFKKNNIIRKYSSYNMDFMVFDSTIRFNNNYWNRPRLLPKVIFGWRIIDDDRITPKLFVDWRPAVRPYDILSIS